MNTNYFNSKTIAKIGIFAALSFVLYMFPKFPLPIFPQFLEINFSDVPMLISGFVLGPLAAVITAIVRMLLKLPFSTTSWVGEIGDLIIGGVFAVVPALIYKRHKTMKYAFIGIIAGALASTAIAIIANIYFLIPFYVEAFFKGNWDILLGLCSPFIPNLTRENFFTYYSLYSVLPFNLIRCAIGGTITFLLYKRISILLKKF